MAAQGVNKQVLNRKGTNYPARMAGRTAEVRAVGAWVQPESRNIHTYYEAVVSFQRRHNVRGQNRLQHV